ncbi:MAG: hypothetical protein WBN65_01105 [Gammaproteobacteria bacterium]
MATTRQPDRKRAVRSAVVLFVLAIAVYGSFIFVQYLRSQGGT